ncbi:aldehyde dehydrogenase [Dyadobacter chenwenxiniae]|uniref:Aldehyde dehydrogenase n=1 Tax=Dyadobacter chenwenxiniae TaxID=2906456 RepID=A0A9X1PU01_9BACT|nr:aldehyde dehydrogenase [Dyadobacter chenwenxiniae]MCF0065598.1 aldehyde dehydrogenase [Dyadobacter chenwenxiniae]UON85509.1 aldehyde dehydrogenase [Dyadobacter chenwenxiniae]
MKSIIINQKQYFNSNATKPVAFRLEQLKKLRTVLKANEKMLTEAVYKDFQKGSYNTFLTEFAGVYVALNDAIKNVGRWSKIKRAGTSMVNFPGSSYVIPEPLGSCLVIGSWNYPINLTLVPAIAAMVAGNTVVMKPSELSAHTSAALANIISNNFDPSYFAVLEGGVDVTTEALSQPFDKIFFTGSVPVGKVVYQAASKNLVPVTLELGGKSPLIIAPDANLKTTVKRLVWGKFVNAGQTCVAPDYVLVHKSIEIDFLSTLKNEIAKGDFFLENDNYAQIISEKHFDRLTSMIEPTKVFIGGNHDRSKRFIAPTVLVNVTEDDKIMADEVFGPILPVMIYENIDDAITFIKARPKPLSLYLFSESSSLRKKIWGEISFGGGMVNDVLMHFVNESLPFGGVGNSGMGNYHGEAGFKTFSHFKSVIHRPTLLEFPLKYFPFTKLKFALIKKAFGV